MYDTMDRDNIIQDVLVGIVTAFVSIPISMGYAQVAGLPPAYGLYGSLLPILAFGLLTSSKRFVFGVDAAPAALCGGLLATIGMASSSQEAIKLVPAITLLTAGWLFVFYLLDAGRFTRFISVPVMGGFITGIGSTIILMQVPKLFGGTSGRGELHELLIHIFKEAQGGFHLLSFVLGILTIIMIRIFARLYPRIPMAVIVMVAGALLTRLLHLERLGVKLLPKVDRGFPRVAFPDFSLVPVHLRAIVLSSMVIALVIVAETLLASGNLAQKHGEKLNNRKEIFAYTIANVLSSLVGCCPVNGSVSRSGLADQYGVHSQIMSVAASVTMGFVLLFGTGFIAWLPVPILTGIVISALLGTLEWELASSLHKVDRMEWVIFYVAFFVVLLFGTIYGVAAGVVLSFFTVIVRASRPPTEFLGWIEEDDEFVPLGEYPQAKRIKDISIYRFRGALFFANIDRFCRDIEDEAENEPEMIFVDCRGISSIDVTASNRLRNLYHCLLDKGVRLCLTGHSSHLNRQLLVFGSKELIDEGAVSPSLRQALNLHGYQKPYPLEGESEPDQTEKESSQAGAQLAWAYGEEGAFDRMERYAGVIGEKLLAEGSYDWQDVRATEEELFHGYWNMTEEAELLCHLAIWLSERDKNKDDVKIQNYLERIRLQYVQTLAVLERTDSDAAAQLEEMKRRLIRENKGSSFVLESF